MTRLFKLRSSCQWTDKAKWTVSNDLWQQLLILCSYWQELNLVVAVIHNDLEHIAILQVGWHLQWHGQRGSGLCADHGQFPGKKVSLDQDPITIGPLKFWLARLTLPADVLLIIHAVICCSVGLPAIGGRGRKLRLPSRARSAPTPTNTQSFTWQSLHWK